MALKIPDYVKNEKAKTWIQETATLCNPDNIHWCNGTQEEYNNLTATMVKTGTLRKLNPNKRPNSYLAWSDPKDVARVEESTYICSKRKEDAGPTNNWQDPHEMKTKLKHLFKNCMRGRTLYVIP